MAEISKININSCGSIGTLKVSVTGLKQLRVRLWIGNALIFLAAKIMNFELEISGDNPETRV